MPEVPPQIARIMDGQRCRCGRPLYVEQWTQSAGRAPGTWREVPYIVVTAHCGQSACLPYFVSRPGRLHERQGRLF